MATISATSLQPDVDVAQASLHLEILHKGAPGFISVVLLGADRHERHCFFTSDDLVHSPETYYESREALQDVVDARWNVYIGLSTFSIIPDQGRGKRSDVLTVPGVWADVDVKPDTEGYFSSEADVIAWLTRLPRPTLEVATGSGGRHLYWLTHKRLDAFHGQNLLLQWLDFLRAESGGITIENVHDTTRILRLAGTTRWPKVNDTVMSLPQPVRILFEGPRYHANELLVLSQPAHDAARVRREEMRATRTEAERQRHQVLAAHNHLEGYRKTVSMFNIRQDWEVLLTRAGWTLHSDQRDQAGRCRYWTRPGKKLEDGKSAATDYTDESGITSRLMTIYSNDPGLADLTDESREHDAVKTCSKWHFAVTKLFDGDENALGRALRDGSL